MPNLFFKHDVAEGRWSQIVDEAVAASSFPYAVPEERTPDLWVTVAPVLDRVCTSVRVEAGRLAEFVNIAGDELVDAGFKDVQLWLHKRSGKTKDDKAEIWGLIIDVDEITDDVLEAVERAGAPMPTAYWHTAGGYKLAYAFDAATNTDDAEYLAKWLTLAFEGGDPGSWKVTQGQHMPHCWKSLATGDEEIDHRAFSANPVPLAAADFDARRIPHRLATIWGSGGPLTEPQRLEVEQGLHDRGIYVAEPGASSGNRSGRIEGSRRTSGTYAARRPDGSIFAVFSEGLDGVTKTYWTDAELHRHFRGESTLPPVDAVRDVPATFAGLEYRSFRLRQELADDNHKGALIRAAEEIWSRAKAEDELHRWEEVAEQIAKRAGGDVVEPGLDDFADVQGRRLARRSALGTYYDVRQNSLQIIQHGHADIAANVGKSGTLPIANHRHEWRGSEGFRVTHKIEKTKKDKCTIKLVRALTTEDKNYLSHWNKAIVGHQPSLGGLGIPAVLNHAFPVAFATENWSIDPASKCIEGVRLPVLKPGDPEFDVLGFFHGLFRTGQLPLASEEDVPRLLMAIASPLLRELAPGLLGSYWIVGPPGLGKDYLAELIAAIWELAVDYRVKSKFDLSCTDDLEMKRSFFAAPPAIFARAKEAGKRKLDMINIIIRVAGTDRVPARGMRRDEISIPNTFTIIADSAESLPEKREISRRAVAINGAYIDDKVAKGLVLRNVLARAPDIVQSLLRLVQTKDADWYRHQSITDSRPVVPVALAKLLGAELPVVEGRNLGDIFGAFLQYTNDELDAGEGKKAQGVANKKHWKHARKFPNYPLCHFIDVMGRQAGYSWIQKEFGTVRQIVLHLERELPDYHKVKHLKLPYMRIEIHERPYAFRLVNGRHFVLEHEIIFCNKLGIDPMGEAPSGDAARAAMETLEADGQLGLFDNQISLAPARSDHAGNEPLSFSEEEIIASQRRAR